MKVVIASIMSLTFVFLMIGCSDQLQLDELVTEEGFDDLEYYMSRQDEIALVDLSTLSQLVSHALSSDPEMTESELRDRLFRDLMKLKKSPVVAVDAGPSIPGYDFRPTWQEFWLLLARPWRIKPTNQTATDAFAEAKLRWSGMAPRDTKRDAFRHSYWNVLMSKRISIGWAKDFATAHESESGGDPGKSMDLHNNWVGRNVYSQNKSKSESWLSDRLKNYTYKYYPASFVAPHPSYRSALVYID